MSSIIKIVSYYRYSMPIETRNIFKKIFGCISMVEFVFICIAVCYTGSSYLGNIVNALTMQIYL